MIQELFSWLDAQRITYIPVDTEVVDIPGFGRLFTADLSGVESIFRGDGDKLVFNLMESPDVLMEEGIFHVAFPFGRNWYYYDLREEFRFNLLKYIGRPKPPVHDVPFVNLGIHTSYELLNACFTYLTNALPKPTLRRALRKEIGLTEQEIKKYQMEWVLEDHYDGEEEV